MKHLSKLKNIKLIPAVFAVIGVIGGGIFYYTSPRMSAETEVHTLEERQAIADEVKDYLVKYVVSDGFVEDIGESADLQTLLAEKMESGEIVLLNEEQIDEIARYAADNYNTLLDSNIDTLTDEQIAELEKNIRDNIIVTIGEKAPEDDVNNMTGGVSSIVIKNILAQLEQMDESIKVLQEELNSIKESIELGSSLSDVSSSIGKLEDRLDYVKNNLTEEDAALAGDIEEIEEELRTLHVNVDETATVVVQLESTMDDLTRSNLDALAGQISGIGTSVGKINTDFQSILDKISSLQGAMNNKDAELSNIVKESSDKIADFSGLISALQKELSSYRTATDKSLKNLQDTQSVLDKNLSSYKNTTDSTLTDLSNGQNAIDRNLKEYQDTVNADITNIYTILQNLDNVQQGLDVDLSEINSRLDTLDEGIRQCFTSVSSGKAAMASALTDKGIATDATEAFEVFTDNIRKIGAESNIISSAVLSGYKAYANNRYIEGSMTNQGAVSALLNCGDTCTIPSGYHDGNGRITANTLENQTPATATAASLTQGKTAWVNGRLVTGTGADNTSSYNQGYTDGAAAATGSWKDWTVVAEDLYSGDALGDKPCLCRITKTYDIKPYSSDYASLSADDFFIEVTDTITAAQIPHSGFDNQNYGHGVDSYDAANGILTVYADVFRLFDVNTLKGTYLKQQLKIYLCD